MRGRAPDPGRSVKAIKRDKQRHYAGLEYYGKTVDMTWFKRNRMILNRTEMETTNMEHLIKKIADISKEKDCPINLSITPDNKLTIMVATKKRIFRLLDADESEEYILNTIIEAIKTSEKGFTL